MFYPKKILPQICTTSVRDSTSAKDVYFHFLCVYELSIPTWSLNAVIVRRWFLGASAVRTTMCPQQCKNDRKALLLLFTISLVTRTNACFRFVFFFA